MTEYKSEVKKIFAPVGRVYERLADLNNLAVIQQGLDNPEAMRRIQEQAGDKVKPEQLEQVIEKFGTPDEYYNEDGRYDAEWQERGYRYGNNYIETCDGEFWMFEIRDTRFKVLTKYFDGGVGVGDHISVFKGFKDGMLYQRDPKRFGEYYYEIADASDGYFCFRTDPDGYIEYFVYTFPV